MRQGFSLIELIIIISLIVIISGATWPSFKKFSSQPILNLSALAMASEIRKTQSLAFAENKTLAVKALNLPVPITTDKKTVFAASGNPVPGSFGTIILNNIKKIITANSGRVRIE